MTGALIVVMPFATAGLVAASARFRSLVSTILAGYLTLVAVTVGGVLVLSPFRAVDPAGLALLEGLLLAGAVGAWLIRRRPGIPLAGLRLVVREVLGRPETALFAAGVVGLLGYELVLALTVPPTNWDSLTYHLARVAAWVEHGGVYWIANAPTDRMNEFQPLAEQENLFTFAATRSDALFALPQLVAALACLVAVYGTARRLGYEVRASACASFLLATFTLFAIEATTAQNDLVAASFPVIAACLLLGETGIEPALAGVAVGFGLGTKLTTALVLPILVLLAFIRGRRTTLLAAGGLVAGFLAIGMWGFVLNDIHTGHLLGHGGGRVEDTSSPSWPGSGVTALYLVYSMMDLSALTHGQIDVLAAIGIVGGVAAAVWAGRHGRRREAVGEAAGIAIPFSSALIAIGAGGALAYLGRAWGHPVRGPDGNVGSLTNLVGEDFSAFGPLAAVLIFGVPILTVVAFVRGKADRRRVVLAACVPLFIVLLVLQAKWNTYLNRFLVVPVVLAAPLLASLFSRRSAALAFLVVGLLVGAITVTHIQSKPLSARPWSFDETRALQVAQDPAVAAALTAYRRLVPARACVGAVLGLDEPAFLLYGTKFRHHVEYLPVVDAERQAILQALFYVVISKGPNRGAAATFRQQGWKIRPLGSYWLLASEPHATTGDCSS